MNKIYIAVIAIQLVFIFLMIVKMIKGPSIFDRMNWLTIINTDVIITLVVIGYLDGRPEMYIDIAIAYGILGFVSNIVVAKYLGAHKDPHEDELHYEKEEK